MKRRVLLEFLEKLFPKKEIVMSLLLVPLMVTMVYAQTATVTGTVVDDEGLPLPGVSVSVKGTKTGAQTNDKGEYRIAVPNRTSVLVYSFIGFSNQELTVGNRTSINVKLLPSVNKLDDVVIVGYGTQVKRDVTGAISSVDDKEIGARNATSIFEALQGASPGVRVLSSSGAPGEEGQISIRGVSTLSETGGSPLYIVDGVALNNISGINPNDIKNVEILKDAASAAIYGSRSSNGVIIITTKRGEDGKPQIGANYIRSYSNLSHKLPQANRLEREVFERNTGGNLGLYPFRDDSTAYSRNNDWDYQDLISQTGLRDQLDLNVGGGAKNLTYYGSLQYLDETGIVLSSYNKRFTLRTNIDYKPASKIKMATRISLSYQDKNNIDDGQVLQQATQRPAQQPLYLPDGTPIYDNGGRKHPIEEARLRTNITSRYGGVFYQMFEYQILKPLTLHVDGSANIAFARNKRFTSGLLQTSGISTGQDATKYPANFQGNAYATYKKTFNKVHNFSGVLGTNFEDNSEEEVSVGGNTFVSESVQTLNAVSKYTYNQLYSRNTANALLGFYTRANYDYKGRYIFAATFRRDGSSRFGAENRWGNFPAASAGWRVSDEKFMSWSKKFLTDAKFRLSWGITGQQEIGDFDALNQLVFGNYFYNGLSGVQTSSRLGNPNLKWEEQEQIDVGLDLNLFNGRISFTGDYYVKNTRDLLNDRQLPAEIGYTDNARVNLGSIQNKGIELEVSAYPFRKSNFSWQTSVNWTRNRNKITDLPGGDYIYQNLWYVGEGKEPGQFYGYKHLGIYEYDESNAYTDDYKIRLIPQIKKDSDGNVVLDKDLKPTVLGYTYPNGNPYSGTPKKITNNGAIAKGGDVIWENLPGEDGTLNGEISIEDRQILGSGLPKWTIGFNNTFNYKLLTFSFNVFGSFGNKVYNDLARNNAQLSSSNVTPFPNWINNSWKYPGQITDVYSRDRATDNMRTNGSYFLEDGSFIRLQSVRLGYQVPQRLSKKALMRNLNVYLYSNNLATWTAYSGFDPEVEQQRVLAPGRDTGKYPRRREIGFGLSSSF